MTKLSWRDDPEYLAIVSDLLAQEPVQRLANYTQHHHSNRLDHSISVSYNSYLIAKKLHLNARATARGGLLHDLFYYDWRTTKFDLGSHAFIHPRVALRNAEKLTDLTPMEKDIILKHMWGATLAMPRYRESMIVSLVDDYEAVHEFTGPARKHMQLLLDKLTPNA
ncbi:HD superfamily hydrolase [Levilactobacillus namurensis DSM 19117]|uniref:HD superfamily hydrolase n=2 Tax=Levilactobacillus namurensis TaxID=380393 RepID=A0A0R1K193_9LACO|nr:HD domain-containing protein [Levilactobacillus namurensis]PTM22538.1 HD domain-containing protein [Lactobacillus sp. PFC-70]KRK77213.1 HD superfamily hydrolase [Levilactobacillus namurensis DSM 19117]MCW3777630.1 HD domain-containing protein [Levilactobacillus namurensis]MDT7014238.1 HD domain-containing protein [Levilactobacillus namurensis]MDT7018830.1 HD domain-containing protein [Levilactobacillus namurensis]